MIVGLFVAGLVIGTMLALARWRMVIVLVIVFGSLQDPVRKLTPDTPAIMAISSLPIFCAAIFAVLMRERAWTAIKAAWPEIARRMRWFTLSLVPATLLVFQHGLRAWRMAVIGLLGYLAPMAALLTGFIYVRRPEHIRKVLAFYAVFTGLLMTGSFLEYMRLAGDWPALGTAALGVRWIRWFDGRQMDLISGFYRSPDIMGWHAAALTMFALTLQSERGRRRGGLWLFLAAVGVMAMLMAGRRKMILMPVVWCAFVLMTYLRAGRLSRAVSMVLFAVLVIGVIYLAGGQVEVEESYYLYAATSQKAGLQRIADGTLRDVLITFAQSGPLGIGIGTASQGTQHLGLDEIRGWQESGLTKLAAELGVAGMACAIALAVSLARSALALLLGALRAGGPAAPIQVGLTAFLAANLASFLVSHQVYGDPLVMILTAFIVGVVLSSPRWSAVVQPSSPLASPRPLAAGSYEPAAAPGISPLPPVAP